MPNSGFKVIVTRKLPDTVQSRLKELFDVEFSQNDIPLSRNELLEAMKRADVLVPTLNDNIDASLLAEAGNRLKLLANYGSGVDHIDVEAAHKQGILVSNSPTISSSDTADMTIALILAVMRRFKEGSNVMESGDWQGWAPSKTYEKGDSDPNDDGRIMSIEKYPNGYFITGQDGEEGYGYAIDLKGNEMEEEDLEGMYEGKKSNINEAVKNIITKILEEQNINEAATNDLAKIAAEYGDFEGLKPAVIALENVVTEIESFYDKTRSKIQKIYNDLGEIRNEEGLKVGAFIAPSIENAFKRDLRPIIKNQFHGGLDMPKVKRISQDDIDRGYTQMESPKETVFTPVNEKK